MCFMLIDIIILILGGVIMDIDVEQIAKLDHENALCDDLCELAKIASNCVFHKVTEKQIDRAKHILETINCFCTRNKLDSVYSPTDDIETALKQWFFNMLNRDKYGGFLDEDK